MEKLDTLRNFLNNCETDFVKFFDKGNSAAGTRVRKHMQELKKMANDIRTEVQNIKMLIRKVDLFNQIATLDLWMEYIVYYY